MKEFINKLISRLEEEKAKDICDNTRCVECHQRYKTDCRDDCYQPMQMLVYDNAISIVNQLAEEYNNESVKGDLISRSALLKQFAEATPYGCGTVGIKFVDELIKNQPTVCNDGWIPCSSGELPKSGKSVILSYKDRFLTQADGTCEGWYDAPNMMWHLTDYEYSDNVEVIAWRERLAPYQPKGCEKKLTTCADCEDAPCELTTPVQPKGE